MPWQHKDNSVLQTLLWKNTSASMGGHEQYNALLWKCMNKWLKVLHCVFEGQTVCFFFFTKTYGKEVYLDKCNNGLFFLKWKCMHWRPYRDMEDFQEKQVGAFMSIESRSMRLENRQEKTFDSCLLWPPNKVLWQLKWHRGQKYISVSNFFCSLPRLSHF